MAVSRAEDDSGADGDLAEGRRLVAAGDWKAPDSTRTAGGSTSCVILALTQAAEADANTLTLLAR